VSAFSGDPQIAENTPFAGTYVPLTHFRSTQEVDSVMIEIRRDLYQEEPGGRTHAGYGPVVSRLTAFLNPVTRAPKAHSKRG